jgi:hypothetical protein
MRLAAESALNDPHLHATALTGGESIASAHLSLKIHREHLRSSSCAQ